MNKEVIINKIMELLRTERGVNEFAGLLFDNIEKRIKVKKYKEKNKEKIKKYFKKYYLEHKKEIKENFIKYKEYEVDYQKWHTEASLRYYYRNRETRIKYQVKYNVKNKDKIKEYQKEYYKQNKDKISKWHADYYLQNRDKILKNVKKMHKQNPAKKVIKNLKKNIIIIIEKKFY